MKGNSYYSVSLGRGVLHKLAEFRSREMLLRQSRVKDGGNGLAGGGVLVESPHAVHDLISFLYERAGVPVKVLCD